MKVFTDSEEDIKVLYTQIIKDIPSVNDRILGKSFSACWVIFHASLPSADFFKINFSKNAFRNTIRVSNSWDPDQA